MNTIHLTDDELRLARQALEAYFRAFGHDEAETLRAIRRVIAKFRDVDVEDEEPHLIA